MKPSNRVFMLIALALFAGVMTLGDPASLPETALAQTADPVFVGAGDIADCNSGGDEATANLLDGIAGTVYTLGDNAYENGSISDYNNCYQPTWGRHKARTRPAAGNHEYQTSGAAGHYTYFGAAASPLDPNCTSNCKGYYSYNLGTWHIIALNSEIAVSAGSAQEQWLRSDLAANSNACTLAYWHKPRFSSGQHGNNTAMQPLWQALYDYGADVILNGHDHTYERFGLQNPTGGAAPGRGLREFVVGTGGRGFYAWGTIRANSEVRNNTSFGVLKLTLHAASYDWQFVPVAGQTFSDTGTANCVSAAPVATATPTNPPVATATPTNPPAATNTPTNPPLPTNTPTATPTQNPAVTATATNTPRPTNTPAPAATPTNTPLTTPKTVTLQVTDGWNTKLLKLLSADGKLYTVQTSDNVWWETEAGYFTALQFQGGIPSGATILSAKLYIEHHEEQTIAANAIRWDVGGGTLTTPSTLTSRVPSILAPESNEALVEWDIKTWINTPGLVNNLKFVARNSDANGKKTKLDRVYVVVTYQ
jgi:Calcineurin-like phosphoesterase